MKIVKMAHNAALLGTVMSLMTGVNPALAQTARDPHTPGYVTATDLPDGTVPSPTEDGNFIIGPTHNRAPEVTVNPNAPQGTIYNLTMSSTNSEIFPGIARDRGTHGTPDPNDPAKLIVTTSHPEPYTRRLAVYVPTQYVPGTAAPFIVGADGPDRLLFTVLDNLIAERKRCRRWLPSPSAMAAATRRAANADWNITRCPVATRNSSNRKCCYSWKKSAA